MSDHNNLVVTSLQQWQAVAHHFEQSPWLGLDTEFMREKTYYPQLCLVQVSCERMIVCLDPLAFNCRAIVSQLIGDVDKPKIVHSASQDIEVLGYYCDTQFESLYDTQLAAEFCGYAAQTGYAGLVMAVLGVELDKSATRTRWEKRPLTGAQIAYSLDDVRYLKALYDALNNELGNTPHGEWFLEEQHSELARMRDFRIDPKLAWLRLKTPRRADAGTQQIIRSLVNWREKKAQQVDRPKNWILNDKTIHEIAESRPADLKSLRDIARNSSRYSNAYLDEVLSCVKNAQVASPQPVWQVSDRLTEADKQQVNLLRKLVAERAEQHSIPVTRIATRQDIDEYIRDGQGRLASGWRRQLLK